MGSNLETVMGSNLETVMGSNLETVQVNPPYTYYPILPLICLAY
jgi:hypothetical protein